ncbi:MAG: hypothetical protein MSH37_14235, partial [Shigella dysenteriae]|nr:hypothetical protein [Shigella dysenteriae]
SHRALSEHKTLSISWSHYQHDRFNYNFATEFKLLPLNLCRFHYFNIADQKSAIQIKTIKCESATCQND